MLTIDASVLVAAMLDDERAHADSARFLRFHTLAGTQMHEPVVALVEIVAAVVRRTGDRDLARSAARHLLANPALIVHPLGLPEAAQAAEVAASRRLRAADAQYAAVALKNGCQLVTLDTEVIERAGPDIDACGPAEWLAREPGA